MRLGLPIDRSIESIRGNCYRQSSQTTVTDNCYRNLIQIVCTAIRCANHPAVVTNNCCRYLLQKTVTEVRYRQLYRRQQTTVTSVCCRQIYRQGWSNTLVSIPVDADHAVASAQLHSTVTAAGSDGRVSEAVFGYANSRSERFVVCVVYAVSRTAKKSWTLQLLNGGSEGGWPRPSGRPQRRSFCCPEIRDVRRVPFLVCPRDARIL